MYLDELSVGLCAESRRTVTHDDILAFADCSGDRNPVHLDHEYARQSPFNGVIAHGMLSASFISSVLGMQLPGAGTIYLSQSLRFLAPVRPGDEVRTVVTVTEIVAARRRVICSTHCYVGEVRVIDGEATLMVAVR